MSSYKAQVVASIAGIGVLLGLLAYWRSESPLTPFPTPAPLPAPKGTVVNVASVDELQRALEEPRSNVTIVLQPGHYKLARRLVLGGPAESASLTDVALRGSTGNRDDVVIQENGIVIRNVQGAQIANLTFDGVDTRNVVVHGEDGASRPHIYNVRFVGAGAQMLRATADLEREEGGVSGGIVEYSVFEYTVVDTERGYASAISVDRGTDWIVRQNVFRNFASPKGARPRLQAAVVMRNQSRNTHTYQNLFVDCARAIAYGMGPENTSDATTSSSHDGGVIHNNFIHRRRGVRNGDAGIMLWDSPRTRVYHNTIIQHGTYKNAIEYRFPSTIGVDIRNNLTDGAITKRSNAIATVEGNITHARPNLFRNAAAGDLHLVDGARLAIDRARPLAGFLLDWDGEPRPFGARPDIGADEHVARSSGGPR
jgi:hypothetical protein